MKLWSGRFKKDTAHEMDDFHSSISFDKRLYRQDITGSIAHAESLQKAGILTEDENKKIKNGLLSILEDIEKGKQDFDEKYEDIHMNIEKILTDRIGEIGKKLHTGRSRNDQVSLDLKLYLIEEMKDIQQKLVQLMRILLEKAQKNLDTCKKEPNSMKIITFVAATPVVIPKSPEVELNNCAISLAYEKLGDANLKGII